MSHGIPADPTFPIPQNRIVARIGSHGVFQANIDEVVLRLMHPVRVLRRDVRGTFPESSTAREVAVMHKLTLAIILCQE